tara:strand:+ start:716 stop:940 length:225 start_codon:yes stop_codon:yes gene_type:complete
MEYQSVYVKTNNGKKIVILSSDRESLRIKQRNRMMNQDKCNSLRFVSYKVMQKISKKDNTKVIGPYQFHTISRL